MIRKALQAFRRSVLLRFCWPLWLLALALTGCASDAAAPPPSVLGTWQVALAGGCYGTFTINDATWSDNITCALAGGGYGTEIESGQLNRSADMLDFMPQTSSCPAHAHAASARYVLRSGQLVLDFTDTTIVLDPAGPASALPSGAIIKKGCWDFAQDPARFTVGAVEQL